MNYNDSNNKIHIFKIKEKWETICLLKDLRIL